MTALRLEDFLPYRLIRISAAVSARARTVYSARYPMTVPEWRSLASLGQFGRMTAKQIGLHSGMHKTKVSRAVAELETRRWIKRDDNPGDRREDYLTLTPLGLRVYEEIVPDMLAFEEQFKRKLGAGTAVELAALLDRIEAILAEDAPK